MKAKSAVVKRSMTIAGHSTSLSLEEAFWTRLKELACQREISVQKLVGAIDAERQEANLSSAVRVYILEQISSCIK